MSGIRTFRDLIAWQKAMELTKLTYHATAAMPREERFGLVQQMRRAAVSVPLSSGEGYARQSTADYLRFLRIARGSLAELWTQQELAHQLNLLDTDRALIELFNETDRVLQGLIRSIEAVDLIFNGGQIFILPDNDYPCVGKFVDEPACDSDQFFSAAPAWVSPAISHYF